MLRHAVLQPIGDRPKPIPFNAGPVQGFPTGSGSHAWLGGGDGAATGSSGMNIQAAR